MFSHRQTGPRKKSAERLRKNKKNCTDAYEICMIMFIIALLAGIRGRKKRRRTRILMKSLLRSTEVYILCNYITMYRIKKNDGERKKKC